MKKLILIFLLLGSTAYADTTIIMPQATVENFRHSHVFPWRFYKEFGAFPDRDGAYLWADTYDWYLETTLDLTYEQKQAIYAFAEDPDNFSAPVGWHRLVLHIDYDGMMETINTYLSNNSIDLTAIYIGDGEYQYVYFSRDLTVAEKIALKGLVASYITYE